MFANPGGMLADAGIVLEVGQGPQRSGECHFIVEGMNPVMAQSADVDPPGQRGPCIVFFEMRPAVQFPGDQMVEGQGPPAAA